MIRFCLLPSVSGAGVDHILLYGGRNDRDLVLDQCYLLNTQTWTWTQVRDLVVRVQ